MSKKPVIGITSAYISYNKYMEGAYVHHDYQKAVAANGGIPIILPYVNEALALEMVDLCDGIILSGGEDVDPYFYGQDPHPKLGTTIPIRDKVEIQILHQAMKQKKPILAICRGIQLVNVALGGTIIQDINSQKENMIKHFQSIERFMDSHWITIEEDSKLASIVGSTKIRVNSLHHQAIEEVSNDLIVVSKSSDGIIEAVEHKNYEAFFIGVQWHPESMAATNDSANKLFSTFIHNSRKLLQG